MEAAEENTVLFACLPPHHGKRTRLARSRFWLPLACEHLRFGDLRWGHLLCDFVSTFYRILIALRRRQVEPHVRPDKVLRHAMAVGVHRTEMGLGDGEALVGSEPNPLNPSSSYTGGKPPSN
jgi:hypothetical protein